MKYSDRNRRSYDARLMLMGTIFLAAGICISPNKARAAAKNIRNENSQSDAHQLWERAVVAKGGRERLRSITCLYVKRIQPEGDRDYQFHVFPDFSFNYTYGGRFERFCHRSLQPPEGHHVVASFREQLCDAENTSQR